MIGDGLNNTESSALTSSDVKMDVVAKCELTILRRSSPSLLLAHTRWRPQRFDRLTGKKKSAHLLILNQ